MTAKQLLKEAVRLKETLVSHRRYLHTHPGVGSDLKDTHDYVKKALTDMGYEPIECGKTA